MALDPQVAALWAERAAAGARPVHELSVAEARAAELAELGRDAVAPERVATVRDREVPGPRGPIPIRVFAPDAPRPPAPIPNSAPEAPPPPAPIRVFAPEAPRPPAPIRDFAAEEAPRPLPALVYLFGGGWVLGTFAAADPVCRRLANAAQCAVVAVAYRRAPEHRFPAAVEDCEAATRWVADHAGELGVDARRIAVGGASAGGNLAAVVALLARDRGGPALVHQLLVYPVVEHLADTPSMAANGDPFFGARDIAWSWRHYLADPVDGASPLASPLRAPDLRGLPPALVITAEHDPLRDEGEAYAERLAAAGVPVELTRYPGMVHGFFSLGARIDAGRAAVEQAAAALRGAFSPE